MNHDLFRAALAADETFQAELVRVYGQLKAPDARYRFQHDDAALTAAKARKGEADEAWHKAQLEACS